MKVIKVLQQLIIMEVSLKSLKQIKIRQCFSNHLNREIIHLKAMEPNSANRSPISSNKILKNPLFTTIFFLVMSSSSPCPLGVAY